jgi:transposase
MHWFSRLPPDVRTRVPPAVVTVVDALLAQLEADNAELRARVTALEERLRQNSRNSSRPPSSDAPHVKPQRTPQGSKKRSGRKPGGQPGHAFAERPLLPPEELTAVVVVKPDRCGQCRRPLHGDDPDPGLHQVTEIPPVRAETIEYQWHTLTCRHCGADTEAPLPEGVPARAFGPRLQAFVGAGVGLYRLSKRQTQHLRRDCFGVQISLGSITNLEQDTSQALAAPVAEAQRYVQEQAAVHVDETGWREGNGPGKAWLWTATTAWVSVFLIRCSRGAAVVRELLGNAFGGILPSDRWSAYTAVPLARRQLCWAHLRRDWLAFCERGGTSKAMGRRLLELTDQMFHGWHRVRDGTMLRGSFRLAMAPLRAEVAALLRHGARCGHAKTRGTCADILQHEAALWTFVAQPGVEPTNNAAERALRPWVLWRKANFGTQGAPGSERLARLMTVVTTLRQQGRNVLDYLTAAVGAAHQGTDPPSLLPTAAALARAG